MLKKILSSILGKKEFESNSDYEFTDDDMKDIDPFYEVNRILYGNNIIEDNPPKIIKEGRCKFKSEKLVLLHSKYFQTIPRWDESKPLFESSLIGQLDDSLLLIEPMVSYEKLCWGTFSIKSIPALETGLECFQLLADPQRIVDLKELIDYIPELNFYLDDAQQSIKFCSLLPNLLNFIQQKGGITVKDLKELFPDDIELIKGRLYYLAKYGILRTQKEGRYNFYEIVE